MDIRDRCTSQGTLLLLSKATLLKGTLGRHLVNGLARNVARTSPKHLSDHCRERIMPSSFPSYCRRQPGLQGSGENGDLFAWYPSCPEILRKKKAGCHAVEEGSHKLLTRRSPAWNLAWLLVGRLTASTELRPQLRPKHWCTRERWRVQEPCTPCKTKNGTMIDHVVIGMIDFCLWHKMKRHVIK